MIDDLYIIKGVLTWFSWPGIDGFTCECGATGNALGCVSGWTCPECDDGTKCPMQMREGMHHMPHENPDYGPTLAVIQNANAIIDQHKKAGVRALIRQGVTRWIGINHPRTQPTVDNIWYSFGDQYYRWMEDEGHLRIHVVS